MSALNYEITGEQNTVCVLHSQDIVNWLYWYNAAISYGAIDGILF